MSIRSDPADAARRQRSVTGRTPLEDAGSGADDERRAFSGSRDECSPVCVPLVRTGRLPRDICASTTGAYWAKLESTVPCRGKDA